jgi:hypothetical protein
MGNAGNARSMAGRQWVANACEILERAKGIEPSYAAWEARRFSSASSAWLQNCAISPLNDSIGCVRIAKPEETPRPMSLDFFFARHAVLSDRCYAWWKVTAGESGHCAVAWPVQSVVQLFQQLKHGQCKSCPMPRGCLVMDVSTYSSSKEPSPCMVAVKIAQHDRLRISARYEYRHHVGMCTPLIRGYLSGNAPLREV